MTSRTLLTLVVLFSGLLGGSSGESLPTLDDDRSAVSVGVGESLFVDLTANPSTGYAWRCEAVLRLVGEPTFCPSRTASGQKA